MLTDSNIIYWAYIHCLILSYSCFILQYQGTGQSGLHGQTAVLPVVVVLVLGHETVIHHGYQDLKLHVREKRREQALSH